MPKIAYNTESGNVLVKNGKICTTCCDTKYAEDDCCCFLNPSPTAWSIATVYALRDAVSYGGYNWYSLQSSNIGETPEVGGGWWAKYNACGNANWDGIPPYGGIGRTPKKYAVNVSRILRREFYAYNVYTCALVGTDIAEYEVTVEALLDQSVSAACSWFSDQIAGSVSWSRITTGIYGNYSCSGIDSSPTGNISLDLELNKISSTIDFKTKNPPSCTADANCSVNFGTDCPGNEQVVIDDCQLEGEKTVDFVNTTYNGSCPAKIASYVSKSSTYIWVPM